MDKMKSKEKRAYTVLIRKRSDKRDNQPTKKRKTEKHCIKIEFLPGDIVSQLCFLCVCVCLSFTVNKELDFQRTVKKIQPFFKRQNEYFARNIVFVKW